MCTMVDGFAELVNWFESKCDGDWEHQHGFSITTLDNPGLSLEVDLEGTELVDVHFETRVFDNGPDDWLSCQKSLGSPFLGCSSPKRFGEVIHCFLNWVESQKKTS